MKYFTKYLPVDGQIIEGDKVRYSKGELDFPDDIYTVLDNEKEKMSTKGVGGLGIRWHKRTYKRDDGKSIIESAYLKIGYNITLSDIVKVKLFLCTYDIKVGDRFYDEKGFDYIYQEEDFSEEYFEQNNAFKVLGEVSNEALWIKEGDEFNESFIEEWYWHLNKNCFTISVKFAEEISNKPPNYCENIWENNKEWSKRGVFKIKGPCGHFH